MGQLNEYLTYGTWSLFASGDITEIDAIVTDINPAYGFASGGDGMDIEFCFQGGSSCGLCKPNGWLPDGATSDMLLIPDVYSSSFDQESPYLFTISASVGNPNGYSPWWNTTSAQLKAPSNSEPPDCGEACQPDPDPVGSASAESLWNPYSSAASCSGAPSSQEGGPATSSVSALDDGYDSPTYELTIEWQGQGTVNVGKTIASTGDTA